MELPGWTFENWSSSHEWKIYRCISPTQRTGTIKLAMPPLLKQAIRDNTLSIRFKALACLGILQAGLSNPLQAAELDALIWSRTFTNVCLQEVYSTPNAAEQLFFAGQTANSVCGCGGEMMGATLTVGETAFYSLHKKMRGDTKMRWRRGLALCVAQKRVPIDVVAAATMKK
jgi:hypothetical protein